MATKTVSLEQTGNGQILTLNRKKNIIMAAVMERKGNLCNNIWVFQLEKVPGAYVNRDHVGEIKLFFFLFQLTLCPPGKFFMLFFVC